MEISNEKTIRKVIVMFFITKLLFIAGHSLANTFCPALPSPTGITINGTPDDNLQELLSKAAPGTTIGLESGIYTLDGTSLRIETEGITLRGLSGSRETVILDGGYLSDELIQITASNTTIADLTLQKARHHPIHVTPAHSDIVNTLIYNVHVIDPGQQAIKINPNAERTYFADTGEIACSKIELTDSGRPMVGAINGTCYTGGIDAHQAKGWQVRDNQIEGFWCPNGLSEHGIHFWRGSRDTEIFRNRLVNNARGIGFGLTEDGNARTYSDTPCPQQAGGYIDHYHGRIMNNFILQADNELQQSQYGFDSGIALAQSCGTKVLHNTVVSTAIPFSSIEYRFANTSAILTNNLVTHTIMQRDKAVAKLAGNVTGANLEIFIDPSNGDLHLRSNAVSALNQGVTPVSSSLTDIDGQMHILPPDVGADERNISPSPGKPAE